MKTAGSVRTLCVKLDVSTFAGGSSVAAAWLRARASRSSTIVVMRALSSAEKNDWARARRRRTASRSAGVGASSGSGSRSGDEKRQ